VNEVYVMSSWLASCLQGFQLAGWDRNKIAELAGVNLAVLTKPYVSSEDVYAIFLAAEKLHGSSVGLESRRGIVPTSFNSLSLAVLAANDIRSGFQMLVKYGAGLTNAVNFFLHDDFSKPCFGFEVNQNFELHPLVVDAMLATTLRTFRFIHPRGSIIRSIDVALPAPKNLGLYEAYFKIPVRWNANQFIFHLSPGSLDYSSMHANAYLLEQNELLCIDRMSNLDNSLFLMELKKYIRSGLTQGNATIQKVASSYSMSVRSLQRRISQEGTSFQTILENIRQQEAYRYITSTELSVSDIAQGLGFSDAANFTRAFKRWYACSPDQYRKRISE